MTRDQFLCGSALMIILLASGSRYATLQVLQLSRFLSYEFALVCILKTYGRPFCAGSLITNEWVLTAAHCLDSVLINNATVSLGSQNRSGPNVTLRIERTVCHPSYSSWTNNNDICLLKLSSPVDFSDYIYPVCLASAGSTFHTGVSSWVTQPGSLFGAEIVQQVNVPIVGNNECRCAYGQLTENMICAGPCQGDSGGPLVTKDGSIWIQSGIRSLGFGYGCARPNTPGVFTRVSQYQNWISNVTGASQPGFVPFTSPGVNSDLYYACSNTAPTTNPTPRTKQPFPVYPDGSVFSSGGSMIHFSHSLPLCLLVVSLYVLVCEAGSV
uniref:chymotrypsin-like protease CTRL-1 n=1 Tax=Gasterosteus aculeatus aculeatus TaxID=481459 RepID=UPI001A98E475|nr:chymotrypsin-like protease CTRL-1 [Gasterosteus aculeatus aculeatus]